MHVLLHLHLVIEIDDSSGAKLQKEKEKAKKERKEKKKREKEKSKDLQCSESKNQSHKKRKHDEVSQFSGKDGYYKQAKEHSTEQLEKSGLTEENGQPAFIQNFYDSDSTQDCSKKQRLETPNVGPKSEDKATVIRIRFPSMKLRDGEPSSLKPTQVKEGTELHKVNDVKFPLVKRDDEELHRHSDMKLPSVKNKDVLKPSHVKKEDTELPEFNGVKLPSLKPNDAELRRHSDLKLPSVKNKDGPKPTQIKKEVTEIPKFKYVTLNDAELCRHSDTKLSSVKKKDADLRRPNDLKQLLVKNKDVVLGKSSSLKLPSVKHEDVDILRPRDPKLPLMKPEHAEHPRASLMNHKDATRDVKLPLVDYRDVGLHRPHDLTLSLAKYQDPQCARPFDLKRHVPADEPCFSGRVVIASNSTSHAHFGSSRRVRKSERKFKDLIMSWNPPPLDFFGSSDSDGLDWLLDSQKRQNSVVVEKPDVTYKASNDVSAIGDSLQVRAYYLPDNDIYALPYVVPY